MKKLQSAANLVLNSTSEIDKGERLCRAFEIFSTETIRLKASYTSLKKQFKLLNHELKEANEKLLVNLTKLDITTSYLKRILDHIAQGILFININGVVTTYNKAAENILGVTSDEILNHNFSKCFDDEIFGFSLETALEEKQSFTIDCVAYTSPNNFHCELEVATTFMLKTMSNDSDESVPTQGLIIMLKDVTEIRQLQIVASRSDRMKLLGEMAAQVAHEIRNPLGGIKGFASLLKRDLIDSPKMQQMAGYIVEGTDHLNRLVDQILHYARPVQPHFEEAEIIALLNELKDHVLADTTIDHANLNINIHSPFKEFHLQLDQALFKSAILNLIVNAIQAMPYGGVLEMSVEHKSGYIFLRISDSGCGMNQENIQKLYTPFFTTKPDGNGLGLPEVQKVIQAHYGTIDVHSVEGKGTSFLIKIPIHKGFYDNRTHFDYR